MMKKVIRTISLVLASAFSVFAFTACGSDPNVKQEETKSESYAVDVSGTAAEEEREGFHSYPAGKTDPVTVGGVEVKVTEFAVYGYELKYMMGVNQFASPEKLGVDLLAQYAFSHVLFPRLNEANNKPMEYRTATEEQMNAALAELFGDVKVDLTKSVLYTPSKKQFEMWIPAYGCNIYYNIDAVNVSDDTAEIITTYYNELARSTMLGRTTVKAAIENGKPVIKSLSSE